VAKDEKPFCHQQRIPVTRNGIFQKFSFGAPHWLVCAARFRMTVPRGIGSRDRCIAQGRKTNMKLNTRRIIAATVAAVSLSNIAPAAEAWVTSNVKFVYPLGDGNFVLSFVNSPPACTNPGNPKYLYVQAGQNGVNAEGVKAMLATSLSAFLSGKLISAAFDDSTGSCFINRLVILD
jgi:hypothetical protein